MAGHLSRAPQQQMPHSIQKTIMENDTLASRSGRKHIYTYYIYIYSVYRTTLIFHNWRARAKS